MRIGRSAWMVEMRRSGEGINRGVDLQRVWNGPYGELLMCD